MFRGIVEYFAIEHALFLVPIFGFALYDSVFQSFSSILGALSDSYPDVSVTTIQMILAIPPMASIPGTLASGLLSSYVRKKVIAEISLAVIFAGGMIPVIFPNPTIHAMLVCSACVGLGQGFLHLMANTFICRTWEGEERGRALGFKQAFNFVGDALIALVVGYLALANWKNAFLVYLGVIPVLAFAHMLFPRGGLDEKLVSRHGGAKGLKELLNPRMLYLVVLFMFAMMFLYGFNTNIALLIKSRGLGTTADVSKVAFIVSVVSCCLGVLYGKVLGMMGRYTLTAGFGFLAAGMILASFGTSLLIVICGGVLFGVGSGIQQVSTIYNVSKAVDKSAVTMAISIVLSFVSLGAALSPVVINGAQELIFGSVAPHQALLVAGFGYVALTLVEGLTTKMRARVRQGCIKSGKQA
nr:MFS transporter [Adlercreutzia sp. ZJ473]